jgi:hypothetical protein
MSVSLDGLRLHPICANNGKSAAMYFIVVM